MNKLVATTLEGKFHVFDVRTQNASKGFAQVSNYPLSQNDQCAVSLIFPVTFEFKY